MVDVFYYYNLHNDDRHLDSSTKDRCSERLQQIQTLALNLIAIGLISTCEVCCRVHVALQCPQHPVEDGLSEPSTVGVGESTAMADRDIPLPSWNTIWHVVVVALALQEE
jgi:hypothetical protein